jgi:hypothetical protein
MTTCSDPALLPLPTKDGLGYLQGQVYNLSHPGPIPEGWTPPPYEAECTVIVQNLENEIYIEKLTGSKGEFTIAVPPGKYYLRIKNSPISSVSGPYFVRVGEIVLVKAYFDNGMR